MFNEKITDLQPSRAITFMAMAKQLQAEGADVIDLSGGEPDFDTPQRIRDELKFWIDKGYTHYTVGAGLPELCNRIARKLADENRCSYVPDGIIVTPGGKFAVYLTVRCLINPGDEVMYLEPGWVSYPSIIRASYGNPIAVPLSGDSGYKITFEQLEHYVTDKTKLLIINYPNNPTGRMLSLDEAQIIESFMLKHPDIILLSDEMYERISYDGIQNISMASYSSISNRVVTVNGFSKSVAMTGWRIGYLAASPDIKNVIYKLFQHTMTCVSGFIQKAAVIALDCTEEIEQMRKRYEVRRNLFIGGLRSIENIVCDYPEGAFYAWVKFNVSGYDSEKMCQYILENTKVVGVPGVAFGADDCRMRFSFAASEDELTEASNRIREVMMQLR